MSYQAGPIQELISYKKAVLQDNRRDSRIRTSIENTLDFFSKRRSYFIRDFNNNTSLGNPAQKEKKMAYPQGQHPQGAYPQMSNETTARNSIDSIENRTTYEPNMYDPTENTSTFQPNPYPSEDRRTFQQSPNPTEDRRTFQQSPNPAEIRRTLQQSPNPAEDRRTLQLGAYPVEERRQIYRQDSYPEIDLEVQATKKEEHEEHHEEPTYLTLKQRLKHFTFAWYAMTMSTGGVAFTLSVIPNRFEGLTELGTAMFILNLFLFTFVTIAIVTRFIIHPGTLTNAFTNPHEGFFFATFWLTIATMMTNSTAYGIPNTGPWLITALRVAFWMYTFCATLVAIFYYHVLFTVKKLVITNVLPGWVLPVFPAMLVGTLASAIAKTQPVEYAVPMLIAGLSYQGLGMILSIGMYGIYFGRLMTSGLPADMSRPAMFIAVGPPSFTALAFIGMANNVKSLNLFGVGGYTALIGIDNQTIIPDILNLLALISAIFLWVLAFWFFGIAIVAAFEAIHRNDFHLNWYAYVFPNVGFTIATIQIGNKLQSEGIKIVGTGMAIILLLLWILIVVCHVKAFATHKICWPHKDEDAH